MTADTVTNLFGEEVPMPQDTSVKRGLDPHEQMLALYGQRRGFVCGRCNHLLNNGNNRPIFKCAKFGKTRSAATDWRAKWQACGLFEEP